ncbi:MAG: HDOD domain-containing protein [Methylobacter sp.]|nr:HDOD domain-containing protein [Methylobacter sp.]
MLPTNSSPLQIADLFRGDLQLTTPPNVYFELQKVVDDPNKSLMDAGLIIEKDPALSMRLLKIVNSAFFGFPSQIASIPRATALIGVTELQNLVLGTVVIDRFSSLPGGLLSMHDFWARSVRCALISKELCIYKQNKNDLDSIFICGLLHDIGQLVFYRRIPVLAREIGLLVDATGVDETQAENNVIGFDHYQTGAELARLWRLPQIIIETIGQHCYFEYLGIYSDASSIIRIANYLSKMDSEGTHPSDLCKDIPADDLSSLIDRTHSQFEEIFKLFYPTY